MDTARQSRVPLFPAGFKDTVKRVLTREEWALGFIPCPNCARAFNCPDEHAFPHRCFHFIARGGAVLESQRPGNSDSFVFMKTENRSLKTQRRTSLFLLLCLLSTLRAMADPPATFKVSEFTFNRPANWEWVETSSAMRKAQLKITDPASKQTADVIFYHFGKGDGGGTKANVEGWLGQFKEPRDQIQAKTEEVTIKNHKVTYVQAQGTYMSGMPGAATTPMPGYALAGAIIEADEGNVFIRMTGPKTLVKTSLPDFKKMVESALK